MPISGEVDISGILSRLGDPEHGLQQAKLKSADADRDAIFRAASEIAEMSTSLTLAAIPKVVWDVNGYYKDLGINFPFDPTRKELREAYQKLDGHDNERLTYCLKQLINKDIRERYDAMALGTKFNDIYTRKEVEQILSEKASELSEADGRIVTVDELIDRDEKDKPVLPKPIIARPWDWGFYTYKSRKFETDALETWIDLLVVEFNRHQIETVISIGYVGGTDEPFVIREHEGRMIFFINEEYNPTVELAETAVSKYMAQRSKGKECQQSSPQAVTPHKKESSRNKLSVTPSAADPSTPGNT